MKIGVIGAGFSGLAAGYFLSKKGHEVTIFEKEDRPGGLALGFKKDKWKWTMEAHYHHLFVSDHAILDLARDVGHKVNFYKPKTSFIYKGSIYPLDSPIHLIKFPHLPIIDRFRVGLVVLYLKLTVNWKKLESVKAYTFLEKFMGKKGWEIIWKPLFIQKFGKHMTEIPASWIWARIKKRSKSLGYPEGGFYKLAQSIEKKIKKNKGEIIYRTSVKSMIQDGDKITVELFSGKIYKFDKVICTLPSFLFAKITPGLPKRYVYKLTNLKGLGVVTLILTLNKKFFNDNTYWLNINDIEHPYTAVVEHTNLVDNKYYNKEHILYVSKYLDTTDALFEKNQKQLISLFEPYLKKINPGFTKAWITDSYIFKSNFAQPIIHLNNSKEIPSISTPIKNIFLCNIQQVYPWDRGTNYAVELGKKVSNIVLKLD